MSGARSIMYPNTWQPPADMHHAGSQWLIKLELAGVARAELQVFARGNELTVQGRRRDLIQSGFVCHRLEINYTAFSRSFTLPAAIEPGSLSFEYNDGILRVWLRTL